MALSHYGASCILNMILFGNPREPLCSRVYRMEDSAFRDVYIATMNVIFRETAHCERIHGVFIEKSMMRNTEGT